MPIFLTVYAEFFTVYMGRKRWKKTSRYLMIFFTVSFSRFTPSRLSFPGRVSGNHVLNKRYVETMVTEKGPPKDKQKPFLEIWFWPMPLQKGGTERRRIERGGLGGGAKPPSPPLNKRRTIKRGVVMGKAPPSLKRKQQTIKHPFCPSLHFFPSSLLCFVAAADDDDDGM